jgi:DMSO/TMAO reductase YedYZ molybdopterin-dependent catalytic subunit
VAIDPKTRVDRLKRANPTRKPDLDTEGRVPPGQYLTEKFPVLTHGPTPKVDPARWQFRIFGLVAEDILWTYEEFMALPQVDLTSDFHCVTRWSQLDNTWTGVPITEIVTRIGIRREAKYVMVHAYGGYTTNLPLVDLLSEDVIFAHSRNGEPLSADHGWPLRLIVPKLYAWKSAKWVNALEFMAEDQAGFWEGYGYHNHGDPWTEERFS